MKKLSLLAYIFFAINFVNAQNSIRKSLNGYNEADAKKMIMPFQTVDTQKPENTSVWFAKDMINNLITLLKNERLQRQTQKLSITDGIRIYYANDSTGQPTIVIVSTYDTGEPNPQANDNYHEDYYEHSSKALLFQMKPSINGSVCNDKCGGGALLYDTCLTCKDDNTCNLKDPHYLRRSQSEGMVRNFALKKSNINTTSEWFDLDMIADYFDEIKRIKNYDGIRIYFSRHPAKDAYYPGRDSFLIVTTHSTNDVNIHQDYFYCSAITSAETKQKGAFILEPGKDKGELCPYNCNLP